jgi:hypothetical protein
LAEEDPNEPALNHGKDGHGRYKNHKKYEALRNKINLLEQSH